MPDNTRFIEDVGKDWFYSWKVDNPLATEENTVFWIIDYQKKKFNGVLNPTSGIDFDLKQVLNVRWNLSEKEFEIIKTDGKWSANDYTINGDSLLLSFNNPNGKAINFEFTKNDNQKTGFQAIILEKINPNSEFKLNDSSFFELLNKDKLTLSFNEY